MAGLVGGGIGLGLSALAIGVAGDAFALTGPDGVEAVVLVIIPLPSWLSSVLTAYVFALPALARALAAAPAGFFEGRLGRPE